MEAMRHGNALVLVMDARSAMHFVKALDDVSAATRFVDLEKVATLTADTLAACLEEHELFEPRGWVSGP